MFSIEGILNSGSQDSNIVDAGGYSFGDSIISPTTVGKVSDGKTLGMDFTGFFSKVGDGVIDIGSNVIPQWTASLFKDQSSKSLDQSTMKNVSTNANTATSAQNVVGGVDNKTLLLVGGGIAVLGLTLFIVKG